MMVAVAGVDISKASLDVSVAEGVVKRFHNTTQGFDRLLRHLWKEGATVVVCESTGGYERGLMRRLRDVAFPVQVAYPNRVRAVARVCGYEAKTNPLDTRVLSRYGRLFPQPERQLPEPGQQELQDLLRRYPNASIVGSDRAVFRIRGNRYRLVVRIFYPARTVYIRFVGTHAEYNRVNAEEV